MGGPPGAGFRAPNLYEPPSRWGRNTSDGVEIQRYRTVEGLGDWSRAKMSWLCETNLRVQVTTG